MPFPVFFCVPFPCQRIGSISDRSADQKPFGEDVVPSPELSCPSCGWAIGCKRGGTHHLAKSLCKSLDVLLLVDPAGETDVRFQKVHKRESGGGN